MLGDARRAAQNLGQPGEKSGIVVKQQEGLNAGGQSAEKLIELAERRVGVGGAGQRAKERWHELGQELPGAGAAGRHDPAMVPVAHRRRDGGGIAEPHPPEAGQCVGIVGGAGKHQIAALAAECRPIFEESGVVLLDRSCVSAERIDEFGLVAEAHEAGDCGAVVRVVGDLQGRLVVDHLQTMLEPAEKAVRFDQLIHRRFIRNPGGGERPEGVTGHTRAQ